MSNVVYVGVCVDPYVCVVLCVCTDFLPLKDCVVFIYANVVDWGNRKRSSFYFARLLF